MRKFVTYSLAALVAALIFIPGMSFIPGLKERATVEAQDAAPTIRRLRPGVITSGTRTFTMRLDGNSFAEGANILFDGVPLASPRNSSKRKVLLAEVDASLIATAGTHSIQAMNPDGMTSAAETLTVQDQDPNLQIFLDGNAIEEDTGSDFIPTVLTESFNDKSDILFWGKPALTQDTPGGVDFDAVSDLTNDPAEIPVTLRDKNGNISNTELFFVVPLPAQITATDPDTLTVGTEDVPLIVSGNFKTSAVVLIDDTPLPTTIGKNGRLETVIPGSLLGAPTQLVVRVQQDGIQSQDAIIPVTPTEGPFIFTIAPIIVVKDSHKPSVQLFGGNFKGANKNTALLDGQPAEIRGFTHRVMTVAIPDDLPIGPHVVQVVDSDGNMSDSFTFEVAADVNVTTVSGTTKGGFDLGCVSGDEARFLRPRRMSFGPDGLLYITDQQNNAIRTVNIDTHETCTFAGTGQAGYNDSGNVLGKVPTFSFPNGVAVSSNGTVYVTDNGDSVVRRIQRTGAGIVVDTFAGTFNEITDKDQQKKLNSTRSGLASYRDGGLFDSAFRLPDDIVIAPNGTIYIADASNHAIRSITQSGGQSVVSTIAGNGVPGFADGAGANARFNLPTALAISADGNVLFVADTHNNRVRRIDLTNNKVTTLAGGGAGPTIDGQGGDATLTQPIGLALDSNGVLYVSEYLVGDVRRIDTAANVTTLAGGGGKQKLRDGPGLLARFNEPRGLAINVQRGVLYVADYENFAIRAIALR